jgi:molybdopterin-guanine dinucleotide biosynthesis protein A/rhodanese-related sulfurtransferase
VLLGGASSRMGVDKLSLPVNGMRLAQRVGQALLAAGPAELLAIGGDPNVLGPLPFRMVVDRERGEGPLQAVVAALAAATTPWLFVSAGDLPDIHPDLVRWLVARAIEARAEGPCDVLVPMRAVKGFRHAEVLFAPYHRDALAALRGAYDRGERSLRRALSQLPICEVDVADGASWRDLDTPFDAVARGVVVPASTASVQPVSGPGSAVVDVQTLHSLMGTGAVVVDVREVDEYVEAHVPGAQLVPLATVPDSLGLFGAHDPVYVICHSGGRSQRAVEWLGSQGINAVNVAGGTAAWIAAGFGVETGPATSATE